MDNHTKNSVLAEVKATAELINLGFDVFTQVSGKSPFDLVAYENGRLLKVEVKSGSRRNKKNNGWIVQIKRNKYSGQIGNYSVPFSTDVCDILAVYIVPLNKVLIIRSEDVTSVNELIIYDEQLEEFQEAA